jgi:hypothetical protein
MPRLKAKTSPLITVIAPILADSFFACCFARASQDCLLLLAKQFNQRVSAARFCFRLFIPID